MHKAFGSTQRKMKDGSQGQSSKNNMIGIAFRTTFFACFFLELQFWTEFSLNQTVILPLSLSALLYSGQLRTLYLAFISSKTLLVSAKYLFYLLSYIFSPRVDHLCNNALRTYHHNNVTSTGSAPGKKLSRLLRGPCGTRSAPPKKCHSEATMPKNLTQSR